MGRETLLGRAVPLLEEHLAEGAETVTTGEAAELLGVSGSAAHGILAYMDAIGTIDRVRVGPRYHYFLRGAHGEGGPSIILEKVKGKVTRRPRRRKRAPREGAGLILEAEPPAADPQTPSPPSDLLPALAMFWTPPPEPMVEAPQPEPPAHDVVGGVGTPLLIRVERCGRVKYLPKGLRPLSNAQTRYLKERYLKGLDGYEKVEEFNMFFASGTALERREYGNIYYICRGEPNSWKKIYRAEVIIRDGIEMNKIKFELKPLEEAPKGGRTVSSKYDPVLDQFMESGYEVVQINLEELKQTSARTSLAKRIEVRSLNDKIEVGLRGGVLYLKKLHSGE